MTICKIIVRNNNSQKYGQNDHRQEKRWPGQQFTKKVVQNDNLQKKVGQNESLQKKVSRTPICKKLDRTIICEKQVVKTNSLQNLQKK